LPVAGQGELRGRPTLSAACGQSGVGTGALNATVAALRFFFRVTLKRSAIRLVNKSPLNAGSAHPIKPANLLDRVRKMRSTNLARTPPATKSP
jgi:hypothetical protein